MTPIGVLLTLLTTLDIFQTIILHRQPIIPNLEGVAPYEDDSITIFVVMKCHNVHYMLVSQESYVC